ncbi:MAG TPA: DMT family transporter [Myxococcales bacterium]|jgi:drug/metabolite transporter (DMT)-like permease
MSKARASGTVGTLVAIFYIFLWASAFVPSRLVSISAPPLWILALRFVVAGGVLLAGALFAGIALPRTRSQWLWLLALGFTGNTMYLGFTYLALRHLSSGMGAIIASTNPLILALAAPWLLNEPLTLRKLAGMLLGFGGVVIAMHSRAGTQSARPWDVLLAVLGVVGSMAATIIYKRMQDRPHQLMLNAVQLAAAGVFCIPVALALHGPPVVHFTSTVVIALIYLVLVMSIGASLLWFWLLRHGDASRVTAWYFLTPVFGLLTGAVLLHERLVWMDAVGLVVIAVGLMLVTREPVRG